MDIVQNLVRVNSLLLQGQYEGAEHILDSAIVDVRELIGKADNAEQLQIRMGEMAAEIDRLNAEREQLLAQEPAAYYDIINSSQVIEKRPLYECPIPAQQSPAVAVPDSDDGLLPIGANDHPDCRVMYWSDQELRAIKDYAKRCIAAAPSPRITEQDAREIISDYLQWKDGEDNPRKATITIWFSEEFEGRATLNKLNAKGDSNANS